MICQSKTPIKYNGDIEAKEDFVMKPTSRFGVILFVAPLLISASLLLAAPGNQLPAGDTISLADAVDVFNRKAEGNPIGKTQPVLTEDAVIAAIRWAMSDRRKLLVRDETFQALDKVIATRTLPKEFELEYLTGYESNEEKFDVWSVRLRISGGTLPNGTTCIMISETMIRSKTIGAEERKVISAWQKKWKERGSDLTDWGSYLDEKAAAAAIDERNGQ